jgi:hypothetical protein
MAPAWRELVLGQQPLTLNVSSWFPIRGRMYGHTDRLFEQRLDRNRKALTTSKPTFLEKQANRTFSALSVPESAFVIGDRSLTRSGLSDTDVPETADISSSTSTNSLAMNAATDIENEV